MTDRHDEALKEFELASIKNGRKLTPTMGTTVGVAANVTCERGGHDYCQIFFQHSGIDRLLNHGDLQARYFLDYELSHANDLSLQADGPWSRRELRYSSAQSPIAKPNE